MEFLTDKKIDLTVLTSYIQQSLRYNFHGENTPGFSGLSTRQVDENTIAIKVIWSDDGVHGYAKNDFTEEEITKIKEVIANY